MATERLLHNNAQTTLVEMRKYSKQIFADGKEVTRMKMPDFQLVESLSRKICLLPAFACFFALHFKAAS